MIGITNKPTCLTLPLLEKLPLLNGAKALVCGDTLAFKKPHPAPMHYARDALNISQGHNILYVGDAQRDIDAGNAANMHTAIASWGYINPDANIKNWGARFLLDAPGALLELTF
ncbi:HAD family hydrolase [Thalassotalea litorea]|uniref:HAD family hydrolase n=1 Tax=Thalassotalea litorea TaxID=2020715 RepID=UPI0037365778